MKYRVGDRFMAKVKGEFLIREVVAVDCDHPHGYHYKMMANDSKPFWQTEKQLDKYVHVGNFFWIERSYEIYKAIQEKRYEEGL